MLTSMTGYGSAENRNKKYTFNVEIKSVNNRFMDIVLRTNSSTIPYEKEIVSLIKKKCIRGRINVNINIIENQGDNKLILNKNNLNSYISIVRQIKKEVKLNENISLNNILRFPDVISKKNISEIQIFYKNIILRTLRSAVNDLNDFRKAEGVNLHSNIKKIFNIINAKIKKIELLSKTHSKKEMSYYKNKIKTVFPDYNKKLDNDRVYQEIAIIMEKKDINEEIIRLKSHMKLFNTYLNSKDNTGKKMNFLLQEMSREINTIGSKSDKIKINHIVVDIKDNLEKIKEQVQNIL